MENTIITTAAAAAAIPMWQALSLTCILTWVFVASSLNLTQRIRSMVQPWVARRVAADVPLILRIQRLNHGLLDNLFSALSCVVSVSFYTGFLPLLFWSGHCKLGRQMTILMAFCDYVGNAIKDLVSAPRPSCPPVRRITYTKDEKENSLEYGLPSSHALNTVCLSGYMLHYILTCTRESNSTIFTVAFAIVVSLVLLTGLARIYLGMHSLIDVLAGVIIGLSILGFWLVVHGHIDDFVVSGQNVTSFWASLSLLLLFAYPKPEFPTPSFEYHAAFDGVAFGIISGVQQTYLQFHNEAVPRIFSEQMPLPVFIGRVIVGIPAILIVKFCSKALSKWMLPVVCNTLGIPIRSSCYLPALKVSDDDKKKSDCKQSGYLQKMFSFISPQESYDVDTGIRFLQYAGLAWSVVDLVPSLFSYLRL
ncbi:hypothetical protein QJS04_geneDACA014607 [Acorus gramineus]|uniref:Phosphatidic acid phosphatase type 2/haloperoxidase domain-containing protein n=1 Tax=Acorus gramineus TaxID=55184 RepID=A0AAV9APH4_ACOGR|nr:hypothetical protein QJS04_geneDACA014607 [Acorus gramineus]